MQRVLGGGADLVTDPEGFRGSLSTWRDVALTGELGHRVDDAAPSGVGHQLATPSVQTFGRPPVTAPLIVPGDGAAAPGGSGGGPVPSAPPAVAVQRAEGPAVTSAGAVPLPVVRRLAAEPPSAVAEVRAEPPVWAEPSPGPGTGQGTGIDTRTDTGAAPDAGAAPTVARSAAGSPPPGTGSGPRFGFGLGEPLTGLPPTAGPEIVARSGGAERPPAAGPPADGETAPLLGETPALSVQGFGTGDGPEAAPAPDAPGGQHITGGEERSGAAVPPAVPPPVPAGPVPALQRLASDNEPVETSPASVVPLTAQRSVGLIASWDHPVATRAADSSSPVPPTAAPPAPAPGPVPHPAVQRIPAAAPSAPAPADPGAVAVAAGVAQRMADGSVVFRPPPAAAPPPAPAAVVQRAADDLPEPPAPEAEFTPSFDSADQPEPIADPGQETPAATATHDPSPTAPDPAAPPKVTDELVRALFAPLSRLLRAELRLERERAGRLINTRH
ncbi:hypothetical protein HUT13_24045 [Streptomyces harbinensis]|uniref:hypothetical protein n=1 Tax=Streptomyces harbinensis TaxID=1176198 RepID=UPI00158FBB15|nr:hypothetical protein [Streptomyces harbinensis]QKV71503.1 hypothetical protein HUT13_24045 [Streptomyces harbinensis]